MSASARHEQPSGADAHGAGTVSTCAASPPAQGAHVDPCPPGDGPWRRPVTVSRAESVAAPPPAAGCPSAVKSASPPARRPSKDRAVACVGARNALAPVHTAACPKRAGAASPPTVTSASAEGAPGALTPWPCAGAGSVSTRASPGAAWLALRPPKTITPCTSAE